MAGPMIGSTTIMRAAYSASGCGRSRRFPVGDGRVLLPSGAGCEVELMFAGAPAAGADSDEVHDLVSLAGSGLAYHVHAVVWAGISLGLVQTAGG
jgi:hypothetical protein